MAPKYWVAAVCSMCAQPTSRLRDLNSRSRKKLMLSSTMPNVLSWSHYVVRSVNQCKLRRNRESLKPLLFVGWHIPFARFVLKLRQQCPQGFLLLKQCIKTIRGAIDKGILVRIAHIKHLGDSL